MTENAKTALFWIAIAIGAGAWMHGCDDKPRSKRTPRETPTAHIEKVLPLSEAATAYIVAVPTDTFEAARCIVVASGSGALAVSCPPPGYMRGE